MTREEAIAVLRREIEPSVYEDEKSIAEAIDLAISALSAEPKYEDKAEVMRIIEDAQIVCHWNVTDDFDDIAENIIEQTRKCILLAIEDELPLIEPYTDIVPITDKPIGEFDASTGIVTYYGKTRPSDLISRADAIEAVASRDSTDGHTLRFAGREITDLLSALPSADAEWIPCSERLPSKDGKYLVTFSGFFRGEPSTDIAYYGNPLIPMNSNDNERDWYIAEENGDFYIESVVAWQPLPKPYEAKIKGGDEE